MDILDSTSTEESIWIWESPGGWMVHELCEQTVPEIDPVLPVWAEIK